MNSFVFKIKELIWKLFQKEEFSADNLVCYIKSGETLPPPFSDEEEKYYITQAENGSQFAREQLIEHNLRLVIYIAKKYENTGLEFEDIVSIGSVGLIKAVKTFHSDKNIKLATYASRCIENEILMQLRKSTRIKKEVSLEQPLSQDKEGNILSLSDTLANDDEDIDQPLILSDEKKAIWSIMNSLADREREIMLLRYGLEGQDEMTQKEIADKMGISQSYISRIEKKVLCKMKKELSKTL